MSTSTPPIATPEPPTALSSLASSLDASGSDIPSFLNNLLSQYLSPAPPPPNPIQPPDLVPIDKSLNELLTQLSLLSQDTNSSVEQSIHDVSRTVPRLAYDLQFMRESANGLSSSLGMVQDRFARQVDLSSSSSSTSPSSRKLSHDNHGDGSGTGIVENEGIRTNKSLEKLTHLDKLKNRLESARDILREAESWSTLESEIIGYIQSNEEPGGDGEKESNFIKAGSRLKEASRSMIVFQNTPAEYEDRKRLLISLQNELEINVSKALIKALNSDQNQNGNQNQEKISDYYHVFKDMDRIQEFKNYYFKSKSESLLKEWKEVKLVEQSSSPIIDNGLSHPQAQGEEAIKFSTFLPKFYSSLLTTLNAESENIPLIFEPHTSASILATFVQTIFDSLDPSFSARLSEISEYHGPKALPELISAYKATEELGVSIQNLLDRMTFNTQGGLLSGDIATSPSNTLAEKTSPGHVNHQGPSPTAMARTSSKKMSISRRFSRAPTISGPQPVDNSWETTLYEPFLDYQSIYATLERRYLENIIRTDPALQPRPSKSKDISRSLIERVNVLLTKANEAINRCLVFTHGYGSLGLLSALEAGISTFMNNQKTLIIDQIRTGDENSRSKSKFNGSNNDELDFEGLDYSTEDWSSVQLILNILESCKEISSKLARFEDKLEDSLMGVEKILKSTGAGEGYDTRSTTYGSTVLLQQSTLNSIDLHTLISGNTLSKPILPISLNSLKDLIKSNQLILQSIILSPLMNQLETYPHLQVWLKPDTKPRKGELQVPIFSLSPTDVISRVSEGLLDLLRVFEVYSKDKGLSFSLNTLPFIENSTASPGEMTEEEEIPSEIVLSTWISSISLTLLSNLTYNTLPQIKNLTVNGQNQLKTDLNYLSNAVGALDVSWEDLNRWERAFELDEAGWRKEMRDLRGVEGEGENGEREREVVRAVGRMRGWI